ncbi:MAG: hypothetical protein ABFS17_01090, partial [Chloroflexota bacterium]
PRSWVPFLHRDHLSRPDVVTDAGSTGIGGLGAVLREGVNRGSGFGDPNEQAVIAMVKMSTPKIFRGRICDPF